VGWLQVDLFDYQLPPELIAQEPLLERDASRLMVLHRGSGEIEHRRFTDIAAYLEAGDCLVLNDTRVIPARLLGVRAPGGGPVELLLLRRLGGDRWEALARPGKRVRPGAVLEFGGGGAHGLCAAVLGAEPDGRRVVRLYVGDAGSSDPVTADAGPGDPGPSPAVAAAIARLGRMPTPPYIRRQLQDPERYQTAYARHEGSAAAPTAGFHFTPEGLDRLRANGVTTAFLTLHVGLGTFRPIRSPTLDGHVMHAEDYEVTPEAAAAVNACRAGGGRAVAVGTTAVRTLESASDERGILSPGAGATDLFIVPGHRFRAVDAMLTNFHLPRSTLLVLVCAFAGREPVLAAYHEALARRYRFYSFGDAMLVL